MNVSVREMRLSEVDTVIDYFHRSTPEHLETLGVDPTRLPRPDIWRERLGHLFSLPVQKRAALLVAWLLDEHPVGFSSCDKIIFGERANMHLHVIDTEKRNKGFGAEFVKRSVELYFNTLALKSLYCEPNAFNVAPNRAVQKAGFKYVKTYMTVPGPLNLHQAVTRWAIER